MTKKTKLLSILLAAVLVVPMVTTTAFALTSNPRGFYGYLLPKYKGMSYTSTYPHLEKSYNAIEAKVDKFTGTSKCYLWGSNSDEIAITSTGITFTANGTWKTLRFTDGKDHFGKELSLGMMNYISSSSGAWVDGAVDFY